MEANPYLAITAIILVIITYYLILFRWKHI